MLVTAAKYVGVGLILVSLGGVGTGIGVLFGCYVYAISRNPAEKDNAFQAVMTGFALTEAIAIFALLMAMILLFVL